MLPTLKIILSCLIFGASVAWADCAPPQAPTIPDGSEATMEEMLQGKSAVSQYQKDNEAYRNCLSEKIDSFEAQTAAAENKDEVASIQAENVEMVAAYNAAVTAEEALADQFNKAIRAYKKANPG